MEAVTGSATLDTGTRMHTGKIIILIGLATVALGATLLWAPWLLSWFGRLPGDIRIDREGVSFRFPVVSMLAVSIVLTVLVNLIARRL